MFIIQVEKLDKILQSTIRQLFLWMNGSPYGPYEVLGSSWGSLVPDNAPLSCNKCPGLFRPVKHALLSKIIQLPSIALETSDNSTANFT